jgi:hypothetical protein
MNRVFDYNGTFVSASKPVKTLKTVKKTFLVDSADRDTVKFFKNGDFVVSLPRVYENVVAIRLMAGEFPDVTNSNGKLHFYSNGQNVPSASFGSDSAVSASTFYFLIDIEGLNKTDECAVGANKSTFTDSYFAKIPCLSTGDGFIEYNDHSGQENIARYTPAIGKLDRMHIRTRLHSQQGNTGFLYWSSSEYSLSFEIEYLDNAFDDFSQFETRVSTRE